MASIKKTGKRLKEARKEARKLAGGQLAAIQSGSNKQLQKQLNRFDKKTTKLISGMERFTENQAAIGAREVARVGAQGRAIAGRGSATGARGTVLDAGIVGERRRQIKRDARTLTGTAQAMTRQGEDVKKATGQAFQGMQRASDAGAGSAATVLDVLAAERRMSDERYLSDLREQRRMMEQQHQNAIELTKLESRLARKATEAQGLTGDPVGSADTMAAMANDIISMSKSETYADLPLAEKQGALQQKIMEIYGFQEPQDAAAISHLVRKLTTNTEGVAGADEVVQDILSVIRGVPGWEKAGRGKKKDHLKKMLHAKVGVGYEALRDPTRATGDSRITPGVEPGKAKGSAEKRFGNFDFRDSTQIGPVGTWAEYKAANANTLYPAEERDVAITLARRRFYNAFKASPIPISDDQAVNLTQSVVEFGTHFSEWKKLSPKVKRLVHSAWNNLPADVREYFRNMDF